MMYAAQGGERGEDGVLDMLIWAGCEKEATTKVRDECGVVIMTHEIVVLSWKGGIGWRHDHQIRDHQ